MYTFICDTCGKEFYSKVDPSGWRTHKCNACSGKQFRDYPVDGGVMPNGGTSQQRPSYAPKPVPTRPVYNAQAKPVEKPAFDLDSYISEMLLVYNALKIACEEQGLTIPMDNLCQWTTSIMIQKGRM